MKTFQSLCVFCGSNMGARPEYIDVAQALGRLMAEQNIRLIYGGGMVGLMGVIADSVLEYGGRVTGVIPTFLNRKEVSHKGVTDVIEVQTMHQRKQIMADLANGFIAMPGGMGTMDEMCEILTWSQLGLHTKPFGLLNVEHYYDQLIAFFDHVTTEKFMSRANRELILSHSHPAELLRIMAEWQAPDTKQWLNRSRT